MTMPIGVLGHFLGEPDVHRQRLADHFCIPAYAICKNLARRTGRRVATVDTLLWPACVAGVLDSRSLAVAASTVPSGPAETASEHRRPEEPAPDCRVHAIHAAHPAAPAVLEPWQGNPEQCGQFVPVSPRTRRGLQGEEWP
jgi:hypothetical protein